MQKLLIAIYVLIVAAISISAKAAVSHEFNVHASTYNYSRDSFVIEAAGRLPNPCVEGLSPRLVQTKHADTLILKISGSMDGDFCIATVGGPFQMTIDPRALKYELQQQGLNPNAAYRIVSEDLLLDQTIDFGQVGFIMPFATDTAVGVIGNATEGSAVLVTADGAHIVLSSPFIDFVQLEGQSVTVFGHAVNTQLAERNFGLSKKSEPKFLVTGFSVNAN